MERLRDFYSMTSIKFTEIFDTSSNGAVGSEPRPDPPSVSKLRLQPGTAIGGSEGGLDGSTTND